MAEVMIRKSDCKTEKDGYYMNSFMSLLNHFGIFPKEGEYDRIESITIKGKIVAIEDAQLNIVIRSLK